MGSMESPTGPGRLIMLFIIVSFLLRAWTIIRAFVAEDLGFHSFYQLLKWWER